MRCNLHQARLEDAYHFDALSYVWNQYSGSSQILCDQAVLVISRSLEIALSSLRYEKSQRHLWVDQICINQDDEPEKEQQIPLMAQIYSKASKVLVWLGEANGETDIAIDSIEDVVRRLEQMDATGEPVLPEDRGFQDTQLRAINHLLHRPWFTRVWTLLEAAVAKECFVLCGIKSFDMDHLLTLNQRSQTDARGHWKDTVSSIASQSDAIGPQERYITAHIHTIAKLRDLWIKGRHEGREEPLYRLLNGIRTCGSTKRRDRVYALYEFLPDMVTKAIDERPKYSGYTVESLFAKIAASEIINRGQISLLSAAGVSQQTLNLPSWVPDWTFAEEHHSLTLLNDDCAQKGYGRPFQASGQGSKNGHPVSVSGTELSVPIKVLGTVSVLAQPFQFSTIDQSETKDFDSSASVFTRLMAERLSQVRECITLAQSLEPIQTGSDVLPACRRVLVAGLKPLGGGSTGQGVLVPASDAEIATGFDALDTFGESGLEFTKNLINIGDIQGKLTTLQKMISVSPDQFQSDEQRAAHMEAIARLSGPIQEVMKPIIESSNIKQKMIQWQASGLTPEQINHRVKVEAHESQNRPKKDAIGFLGAFQDSSRARVFFVMEHLRSMETDIEVQRQRFLGLGPKIAKPGDSVCVVLGSAVPFLLRPVGESIHDGKQSRQFQLLGEAYVHGFMNGEVMEMDDIETQNLVLV